MFRTWPISCTYVRVQSYGITYDILFNDTSEKRTMSSNHGRRILLIIDEK